MSGRPLLIGEFARRCRLPVSTLRYYDRIGLLRPGDVDPHNGYRRYAPAQLARALQIARLRAIGTAPETIAAILLGGAAAEQAINAEQRRINAEVAQRQVALAQLQELTPQSAGTSECAGDRIPIPVCRVTRPALVAPTASFATSLAELPSGILRGVATLRREFRRTGCARTGPWSATVPLDLDERVEGLVFADVAGRATRPDRRTVALPAMRGMQAIHRGRPEDVAQTYAAILAAIDHHGDTPSHPVLEEYLGLDHPRSKTISIRITIPVTGRVALDFPARA